MTLKGLIEETRKELNELQSKLDGLMELRRIHDTYQINEEVDCKYVLMCFYDIIDDLNINSIIYYKPYAISTSRVIINSHYF